MQTTPTNRLRYAAKRIRDGELLIVATNLDDGGRGLNLYLKRWAIECLFADAKTRGPRKTHGRPEKSWFCTGLNVFRNWIIHKPEYALFAWTDTCPRRPLTKLESV